MPPRQFDKAGTGRPFLSANVDSATAKKNAVPMGQGPQSSSICAQMRSIYLLALADEVIEQAAILMRCAWTASGT